MLKVESAISLINIVIILQNITGIYRNFSAFNKRVKILVVTSMVVAYIVYLFIFYQHTIFIFNLLFHNNVMAFLFVLVFSCLANIFTFLSWFIAIRQSSIFRSLIVIINLIHEEFKTEREYLRGMRKLTNHSMIMLFVIFTSCLVQAGIDADLYYRAHNALYTSIILTLYIICGVWKEALFYTELLMFHILSTIVTSVLKQLNRRITSLRNCFDEKNENNEDIETHYPSILENIELLLTTYGHLISCCRKIKQCLGVQVRNSDNFKSATLVLKYNESVTC